MRSQLLVPVILIVCSCTTSRQRIDSFTYNLQFYNYANDQVDNKGETDLQNILKEFREFPWKEQVENLNLPDVKSNPTIGIKDQLNDYDFGVTAYPDNDGNVGFAVYYSYLENGDWQESFMEGYSPESIEQALKLFFNREHDELPYFLLNSAKGEFGIPIGN